jgi:hypothetical protein
MKDCVPRSVSISKIPDLDKPTTIPQRNLSLLISSPSLQTILAPRKMRSYDSKLKIAGGAGGVMGMDMW